MEDEATEDLRGRDSEERIGVDPEKAILRQERNIPQPRVAWPRPAGARIRLQIPLQEGDGEAQRQVRRHTVTQVAYQKIRLRSAIE